MNLVEQLAKASAASPPKRVLGTDLGTTNSTVAQVQLPLDPAGSPELLCECISIEQMTPSGPFYGSLVPSVVAIDKAGKTWIGEGAKRMRSLPRDYELKEVALLREAEAKGDLFVLTSTKSATATPPPPAEAPVPDDSFL